MSKLNFPPTQTRDNLKEQSRVKIPDEKAHEKNSPTTKAPD